MSPIRSGIGQREVRESVVDQPDETLFERDVRGIVGLIVIGIAEVGGDVDGVLGHGGQRLGDRRIVEDRQVGDLEDLLGPVRCVVGDRGGQVAERDRSGVELNGLALLMVMMAVPGVVTLNSAEAPGMEVVKSLSVKRSGL